ncbi:MAG: glycosyltransferase, partial [Spirochaetia bacterium]|nr:glycosyltransferase [Spirochaetia bacterium]
MPKRPISIGVIAAAGKGTRAYPRTSFIPKPLFRFEDSTLLEKNIDLQFTALKVKRLYVIVGHLREQVTAALDDIRKRNPGRDIRIAPWTGQGLAADVASLSSEIDGDFSLILGDEFYRGTNHEILSKKWAAHPKSHALIAIMKSTVTSDIRKNYSVELSGTRVVNLVEKPADPPNDLLGLGTYVFSPKYFEWFKKTAPSPRSGVVELTEVISSMARDLEVHAQVLSGRYFNINSLADYYAANYWIRSEDFKKYKTSLVIPTHNHERTLGEVITDFRPYVSEIVVADSGSTDRTAEIARRHGARVVTASGKSHPLYQAISETTGDIVALTAPDGSFRAADFPKFQEYLKDSDMVIGTRTTRQLIEQGANLRPLYRWVNVALGKLVEILWWSLEPRFTDVGCTYRALWRSTFDRIESDLTSLDRTTSVEMMTHVLRHHMRTVEIPVSFYRRYS